MVDMYIETVRMCLNDTLVKYSLEYYKQGINSKRDTNELQQIVLNNIYSSIMSRYRKNQLNPLLHSAIDNYVKLFLRKEARLYKAYGLQIERIEVGYIQFKDKYNRIDKVYFNMREDILRGTKIEKEINIVALKYLKHLSA